MNLPANPNIEYFPPILSLIQQAKSRALSTANQQLRWFPSSSLGTSTGSSSFLTL